MNLLINNYCNLHCEYCFASDFMDDTPMNMRSQDFMQALEWGGKNRESTVSLFGGEPTLHPQYHSFLLACLDYENIKLVLTASNLLFSEDTLEGILDIMPRYPGKFRFMPNCNYFEDGRRAAFRKNLMALARHGLVDSIGINLYPGLPEVDFIFDLAREAGLSKIRWAVAAQRTKPQEHYDPTQYFLQCMPLVERLLKLSVRDNIKPTMDCNAIPGCIVEELKSRNLLKRYLPYIRNKCNNTCDTIITLTPGMQFMPCYMMDRGQSLRLPFSPDLTRQEVYEHFQSFKKPLNELPLYSTCPQCDIYKSTGESCSCPGYKAVPKG